MFSERMGCSHVPRSYLLEGGLRGQHLALEGTPCSSVQAQAWVLPTLSRSPPSWLGACAGTAVPEPQDPPDSPLPAPCSRETRCPHVFTATKTCRRWHQPLVRWQPQGLCVPGNEVLAASRTWGHTERARRGICPVLTFTCDARLNGQGQECAGDQPWEGHVGAVGTRDRGHGAA